VKAEASKDERFQAETNGLEKVRIKRNTSKG
jgi:hypothetical protein